MESNRGQRPESTDKSGWAVVREILGDFLIVFFGTWLLGRAVLSWIDSSTMVGGSTVLWPVLQTVMSLGIIALGIDSWRRHSQAK